MPGNGDSQTDTSDCDDKAASTASSEHIAGHDNPVHGEDGDIEVGTPDITDEAQSGTQELKDPGVLAALGVMFSTTENSTFFTSVTLSGRAKASSRLSSSCGKFTWHETRQLQVFVFVPHPLVSSLLP